MRTDVTTAERKLLTRINWTADELRRARTQRPTDKLRVTRLERELELYWEQLRWIRLQASKDRL